VKNSILEIFHIFLRLKFSSALTFTKLKRFEISSNFSESFTLKRHIGQQLIH